MGFTQEDFMTGINLRFVSMNTRTRRTGPNFRMLLGNWDCISPSCTRKEKKTKSDLVRGRCLLVWSSFVTETHDRNKLCSYEGVFSLNGGRQHNKY